MSRTFDGSDDGIAWTRIDHATPPPTLRFTCFQDPIPSQGQGTQSTVPFINRDLEFDRASEAP